MNIWIAASDNKIDLVENYINSGNFTAVSADPNGYTPIHAAASYGHKDLLQKLIKLYNGDINIKDSDGDTPLHHVEDYNTCRFIIEELSGNYQVKNNDGLMPVEVLLQNGEDNDKESLKMLTYLQNLSYENDQSYNSFYGIHGLDNSSLEQLKENLKMKLTDNVSIDTTDEMDVERYNRVQHIMNNSENVDADLEKYVLEMIKDQMVQQANEKHESTTDTNNNKRQRR
ncbi:hypothetical protein QEN19_003692 [Hanseniaspora menglaensis]